MSRNSNIDEKTLTWAKEELETAIQTITNQGTIESPIVEARPAWTKPFDVVIGQPRKQRDSAEFLWVIGGSVPIDCINSGVAATPREAARYFSMKWQLEAARYEDPEERKRLALDPAVDWEAQGIALIAKAEYLYTMVDDDQLWS